ncbi:MAG: TetR family transcriptional regulator [Blastopirellula sp.]|nr:MAG: TetR family transcriptional regulator [Blastopirellula sp.]
MNSAGTKKSAARQRIIETAEKLFYAEGIRAVGIDRIIAEAEVAKMTLYNHFGSKDDLILAVLEYREEQFDRFLETTMQKFTNSGMDRLEAFFATLKQWFESKGFRGCSFINAAVELAECEHPASLFAAQHKRTFQSMIQEIVTEIAGSKADSVAPAITLLIEGAIVTAMMQRNSNSADVALEAALALLPKKRKKQK